GVAPDQVDLTIPLFLDLRGLQGLERRGFPLVEPVRPGAFPLSRALEEADLPAASVEAAAWLPRAGAWAVRTSFGDFLIDADRHLKFRHGLCAWWSKLAAGHPARAVLTVPASVPELEGFAAERRGDKLSVAFERLPDLLETLAGLGCSVSEDGAVLPPSD
ncbi:MAG: hypothetical protein AB1758_36320, partial [Candidatus Eremiobacterota bacterium]